MRPILVMNQREQKKTSSAQMFRDAENGISRLTYALRTSHVHNLRTLTWGGKVAAYGSSQPHTKFAVSQNYFLLGCRREKLKQKMSMRTEY